LTWVGSFYCQLFYAEWPGCVVWFGHHESRPNYISDRSVHILSLTPGFNPVIQALLCATTVSTVFADWETVETVEAWKLSPGTGLKPGVNENRRRILSHTPTQACRLFPIASCRKRFTLCSLRVNH
jgi:hypothetical protein